MRKVATVLPREITDGFLIGAIIQSDAIVRHIQTELQQMYPDIALRPDQIRAILANSVLQETVLDGPDMLIAKSQVADLGNTSAVSTANGKQRGTGTYKAVRRE